MIRPKSAQLRTALEQRIGHEVSPQAWGVLESFGRVGDSIADLEDGKDESEILDQLSEDYRELEGLGEPKRTRRAAPRQIAADARHRAVQHVLAAEAARLPSVQKVRRSRQPAEPLVRETIEELVRLTFWTEQEARDWLLDGTVPEPPLATVHRGIGLWSALFPAGSPPWAPITIRIVPRVNARELLSLYAMTRDELVGPGRDRALSEKHAALGVFAAEINDGRTWNEAMSGWNSKHRGQRYTDVRPFARDARMAYNRILGVPLAWRGTKGRMDT